MSAPSLRYVVAKAMWDAYAHSPNGADAEDILAALREACTIRTVEQLRDAAQVGVVIRDHDGNTLVFDSWFVWLEPGGSDLTPVLPAVLLWHPSWEA